jgi:hypothetical protein
MLLLVPESRLLDTVSFENSFTCQPTFTMTERKDSAMVSISSSTCVILTDLQDGTDSSGAGKVGHIRV